MIKIVTYAIPDFLLWLTLGFIFILLLAIMFFIWLWLKPRFFDRIIFIDKNDRWIEHLTNIQDKNSFNYNDKKYLLTDDVKLLNRSGKALVIYSEGKPTALKLTHNKADWLSSDSIMGILNNELVKQIVKPQDAVKDLIILLGAIGGMIAGLAAVLLLLIQAGVINI